MSIILAHDSNIIRTKLRNKSLPALIENSSALHRHSPELKFWEPNFPVIKRIRRQCVGGHSTAGPFSTKKGQEPNLYLNPEQHERKRKFPTDKGSMKKSKKESNYKRRKQAETRKELNKRSLRIGISLLYFFCVVSLTSHLSVKLKQQQKSLVQYLKTVSDRIASGAFFCFWTTSGDQNLP